MMLCGSQHKETIPYEELHIAFEFLMSPSSGQLHFSVGFTPFYEVCGGFLDPVVLLAPFSKLSGLELDGFSFW